MQAKFFSLTFPPTPDNAAKHPVREASQELEKSVNQWLVANPEIRVTAIEQDLSFQSHGLGYGHLVVSLWYEEGGV